MRVRGGFSAALVAAAAATLLTGPAANAGVNSSVSSTNGATAQFLHNGDQIKVCDTQADGESVYAQYKINGGSSKNTSQWNGGSNTCGNKGIGNPAEGSEVGIRAARQAELAPDNYGAWKYGTA